MATRVPYREFSPAEHDVWRQLFSRQAVKRDLQIWDLFSRGINALGFTADRIPDINEVNEKLEKLTGFKGVPVQGFEEPESFYQMLAEREFPIGYFIRDPKDLGYTPAPDVFHDLYGHLPFLIDQKYADFCQDIGARTVKFKQRPDLLRQWERLFWFTVEFALVKTPKGNRIFGGGIASSISECEFALSDKPEVLPFDLEVIRQREFKIDEFQRTIFILESPEQLYSCLDEYESGCK